MHVRIKTPQKIVLLALLAAFLAWSFLAPAQAATGINQQISFQGKLVNSSGVNIPDGVYNLEFKIYQDGTNQGVGSTLKWTEDYLVSASQGVQITAGTFQVNLGSITAFSGIDWNQNTLWLSMNVGGTASTVSWDGEMKPYVRLTSVPYALNSGLVGGLSASQLVQLNPGSQQTGGINVSGAVSASGVTASSLNTAGIVTNTAAGALGTVAVVPVANGGTGISNYAIGDLLYANGTNSIAKLSDVAAGSCLVSGGVNTAPAWGSCASGITLQSAYNSGNTISESAGRNLTISAAAVPTNDMLAISNAGQPVTTAGVNGLSVNYVGGAAAVESAGMRIDYQPGSTSGGAWSGLRIVANATGPVTGVTSYGIKLEGSTSQGAGTEEGLYIGSGWDIGVDIASGGLQLAAGNDPITPAANNIRIYAKSIAGRVMPKWVGPSGVDTPIQANLGFNRVSMMMPAGGTTLTTFVSGFGSTFTNVGTAANPTPTSASLLTSTRRATYTTANTAGSLASHRQSTLQVWRGNAPGLGGFFYTIRFGTSTLGTGNRAFIGLTDSVAAPTNVDPTTSGTIGRLGLAINSNTGNWKWVNNTTGTAPTVTDLGATLPVNNTDLYELVIFSPPNGSSVTYRVTNISTGATVTNTVSTNLPSSFLAPQFWITNNATAGTLTIDFGGWYLESDN